MTILTSRSQTPFGNALPRNSVSFRRSKRSFPNGVWEPEQLGRLRLSANAKPQAAEFYYPRAFNFTDGSSATLTHTWTCGSPRKYQTNDGPSSRQLSHSPSLPMSPSL